MRRGRSVVVLVAAVAVAVVLALAGSGRSAARHRGIDVCTAHLDTRSTVELPGNDAQCAELAAVLARRAAARPVIFGGDVNRRASCAPHGFWTRSDSSAAQSPGLQQVYGIGALRSPSSRVLPAAHTDHDVLIVRARLT